MFQESTVFTKCSRRYIDQRIGLKSSKYTLYKWFKLRNCYKMLHSILESEYWLLKYISRFVKLDCDFFQMLILYKLIVLVYIKKALCLSANTSVDLSVYIQLNVFRLKYLSPWTKRTILRSIFDFVKYEMWVELEIYVFLCNTFEEKRVFINWKDFTQNKVYPC